VDSAANAAVMSLLDCFSGYHRCWMVKEDEENSVSSHPLEPSASYECKRV
jgi:hypothetical protein